MQFNTGVHSQEVKGKKLVHANSLFPFILHGTLLCKSFSTNYGNLFSICKENSQKWDSVEETQEKLSGRNSGKKFGCGLQCLCF